MGIRVGVPALVIVPSKACVQMAAGSADKYGQTFYESQITLTSISTSTKK